MVSIRTATTDDLLAIQNANLHCLPENYQLKYYMCVAGRGGARATRPCPLPHPQAIPWVLEVVRLAIKPGLPKDLNLPRVLFFDELEGTNATDWLGFQRVVQMFNRCV